MGQKTEMDKLRILLPHWIEHSHSHRAEFTKWKDIALGEGEAEAADLMAQAMERMEEAERLLAQVLDKIGGPLKGHHHH